MQLGFALNTKVETIEIQSDQQVYVAGEVAWINGRFEGTVPSKFIEVYLIDRTGSEKASVTLLNQGSRFSGYIELPKEIRTDFYFLECSIKGISTRSMIVPIMIIHPSYPPTFCEVKATSLNNNQSRLAKNVSISGNKTFPTRGLVSMSLSGIDNLSDISINVVREDLLSVYADSVISSYNLFADHLAKGDLESEGHQVTARVLSNETGMPVKGISVHASIMGHQANISHGISNERGEIKFLFSPVVDETRIVFSLSPTDSKKVKVEMLDESIIHDPISFPCISLRSEMKHDIEERLLNVNVMRQFGLKQISADANLTLDTTDFYGKPDVRYILDNYVRFPDMREILFEFVPEVRLRKANDDSTILVEVLNDPYKKYFSESAFVLLDGIPIQNINELLEFNPLKLKSIDVVSRLYYLSDLHLSGIVNYKSYTKDIAGFTLTPAEVIYPFKGTQGFPIPIFKNHKALEKSGLPDMRNLLYRQLGSSQSGKGVATINFYASDSKGNFKFRVQGRDESGNMVIGTTTFSVF
jgi:hypothetical protein